MEKERIWVCALLILLLAFGLFRFFTVLWADQVPPIHDPLSMHHLSRLLYEGFLGKEKGFAFFFESLFHTTYPPLIHFTAQPFLFVLGTAKGAESSFALYLVILLLASYGIGNRSSGRRAGLLSASFVLFTPLLESFSRVYMVDYPLAAITTLAIYLLIKSDGFSRRGYTIFLGLSVCAGMFIKQTFVLYAGLPILFYLIFWTARTPKEKRNRLLVNLAIFFGIAVPLPLIYFLPDLVYSLRERAQINAYYQQVDDASYRILPYLLVLGRSALGPVLALGALVGLFRNVRTRHYWLIILWALPPVFLIDAVHPHLSPRYLLPMLPAYGVLFAIGLESIIRKLPSRSALVFCCLTILLTMTAFFVSTLDGRGERFSFEDFHQRFQEKGMPRPRQIDWSAEPATEQILKGGSIRRVVLLFNSPYSESLQKALFEVDPFARVDTPLERAAEGIVLPELKIPEKIAGYFDTAHWVLLHSNFRQDPSVINFTNPLNPKAVDPVFDRFFEIKHQFALAGRYDIPDTNGLVLLYERISPPGTPEEGPVIFTEPSDS